MSIDSVRVGGRQIRRPEVLRQQIEELEAVLPAAPVRIKYFDDLLEQARRDLIISEAIFDASP